MQRRRYGRNTDTVISDVHSVIRSLSLVFIQSGAADRSLGFEDEDLRSSPGLLGQ